MGTEFGLFNLISVSSFSFNYSFAIGIGYGIGFVENSRLTRRKTIDAIEVPILAVKTSLISIARSFGRITFAVRTVGPIVLATFADVSFFATERERWKKRVENPIST